MNNKKILLFCLSLVLILLIAIGIVIVVRVNKSKDADKEAYQKIETVALDIYDSIHSKKFSYSGTLNIVAGYKGAHGESHPSNFSYNYEIDSNSLELLIGNADGYNSKLIDSKILKLVSKILNMDRDTYKELFSLDDVNKFNEAFDTNFLDINVKVNKSGFFNDYINVEIDLDDVKITLNDSEYILVDGDNKATLKWFDYGWSLNVNDDLKVNYLKNDNKDSYNIVVPKYAFSVTVSNTELVFSTSTESAIYNKLELTFVYDDNKKVEKNNEINLEEIPVFRYFEGVELSLWK